MKRSLDKLAGLFATFGGLGLIRYAPGTFGSLPGLFIGAILYRVSTEGQLYWMLSIGLHVGIIILGFFIIQRTEAAWQTHDDSRIVLDEVIGQSIAASFVSPDLTSLILAFLLFRMFDITKPGLIGKIDRDGPGAFGTLFDDVLAGLVVGLLMWAGYGLFGPPGL